MDRIFQIQQRISEIEAFFKSTSIEKPLPSGQLPQQENEISSFKKALEEVKNNPVKIDTKNEMATFPLLPAFSEVLPPLFPSRTSQEGFINPCPTGKISPYAGDDGLDIHCPHGTPVMAAKDGIIVYNDPSGHSCWEGPGNDTGAIRIKHNDGSEAWYAHLSERDENLKPGSEVITGQIIGKSGTANSVPHLHMSIFYSSGGDEGGFMDPFEMADMFKIQDNNSYKELADKSETYRTPQSEIIEPPSFEQLNQIIGMNKYLNMNMELNQAMSLVDEYE